MVTGFSNLKTGGVIVYVAHPRFGVTNFYIQLIGGLENNMEKHKKPKRTRDVPLYVGTSK